MSERAIHPCHEGGNIILLQECGDLHAHVRAYGGVNAYSGCQGGAGRGDRVAHSPMRCIVQGRQFLASLSKPVCLFIFSNVNVTGHLNPPKLASAV